MFGPVNPPAALEPLVLPGECASSMYQICCSAGGARTPYLHCSGIQTPEPLLQSCSATDQAGLFIAIAGHSSVFGCRTKILHKDSFNMQERPRLIPMDMPLLGVFVLR
jgi:hypothetical protein